MEAALGAKYGENKESSKFCKDHKSHV
ncbi:hypothetical protein L195_g027488, partial [Trifolium pratense]